MNNNLFFNPQVGKQFEKDVMQEVCKLGIKKVGQFVLSWTLDEKMDRYYGTDLMAGNIRFDLTLNPHKSGKIEYLTETYSLGKFGVVRYFIRFSNGTHDFPVPVIVLWVDPSERLRDWDDIWGLSKEVAKYIDPIMETGFNATVKWVKSQPVTM